MNKEEALVFLEYVEVNGFLGLLADNKDKHPLITSMYKLCIADKTYLKNNKQKEDMFRRLTKKHDGVEDTLLGKLRPDLLKSALAKIKRDLL